MKTNQVWWCGILVLLLGGCQIFAPSIAPAPTNAPTPTPVLENWDDRSIFSSGLIKDEQTTLEQFAGASVYHLDVRIADDFGSLQGLERVRYTNQSSQPLDAVYFQLFPNMAGGKSTVSGVKVDGQPASPVYEAENSTVRIPLAVPLQVGKSVIIQMDFKVDLPVSAGGNYGLFGYIDKILVLDGFYPAIPVVDAQGWHSGKLPPNSDTTFQAASFYWVKVTAPASLVMITSGNEVGRSKVDAHQVVTYAAGPARDFYLAASERFEVIREKVGETTVNSYAFKESLEGSQLALRTAVNAIKSFSARFGTYPYAEFDVVSTPMQGALGIEYPGITGINYNLYDLKASNNAITLESTVAHEVGHQWFYNAVGNDQINEPWLDESVTQYVTALYFLDTYGAQGFAGYRETWSARWDRVERKTIPIGLPAGSYQGREYGAIVYGRGALFLDALAQKMGQPVFDAFLRDYYSAYEWKVSTTGGFKQLAEKKCACDLTALFAEWVDKK